MTYDTPPRTPPLHARASNPVTWPETPVFPPAPQYSNTCAASAGRSLTNPLSAEADAALGRFRAELARVLAPMEARLEEAGSSVEEVAARFTAPHRSEAQLEASRPVDAQERSDWLGLERDLQARARDVFAGLHMDRDLLADLARQDILDAGQGSRLADIATLDEWLSSIRSTKVITVQETVETTSGNATSSTSRPPAGR